MGTKFCSTAVLDGLFTPLYTSTANLKLVVMTSSDVLPTIVGSCSASTGCIAISTQGGFPSTAYFTIGSSGNNRYCTIGACSCDTVINTNIASYVVLIDDSSSVRYVTTCTTQSLTAGNKVNIGSWTITVNQPT